MKSSIVKLLKSKNVLQEKRKNYQGTILHSNFIREQLDSWKAVAPEAEVLIFQKCPTVTLRASRFFSSIKCFGVLQ